MTKLTDIEIILVDNYIIKNFKEFSEAHFIHALANTVPTWRSEELVGTGRVYDFEETEVYTTYINQLTNAEKT